MGRSTTAALGERGYIFANFVAYFMLFMIFAVAGWW
jgi:hypothetical protein